MVCAELLNQGYRDNFLKTETKMLLLPTCMRPENSNSCRATLDSEGLKCSLCNPSCNVYKTNHTVAHLNASICWCLMHQICQNGYGPSKTRAT
ncbi:MAG: DUF116 domain-containing protein [Bacteroidales bacterium]|nr:DUF116 domain-containing protein [Bacteroidales bacterium]